MLCKKDENKTKKAYNQEIADAVKKVQEAKVSEVEGILKDLIENPITKTIPGETRIMRGKHYGSVNDLGRLSFIDMEVTPDPKRTDDSRIRQVDPRTLQYVIVNKVKYILK